MFLFAGREAIADWTFLMVADDADWYIDQSETRRRGTMAKVWTLQDYHTPQPYQTGSYRSSKTQFEIRCHAEQLRGLYFSSYRDGMGEGEQVYAQEAAGAWRAVDVDEGLEALYRAGCFPEIPD